VVPPSSAERQPAGLVRRSRHVLLRIRDDEHVDLDALLRRTVEVSRTAAVVACSAVTGTEYPITLDELRLLLEIPVDDWVELDGSAADSPLRHLLQAGLVVRAGDHDELAAREHALAENRWHPLAASFHYATRWRDVDLAPGYEAGIELSAEAPELAARGLEIVRREHGTPPGHFHTAPGRRGTQPLPLVEPEGHLYDLLRRRETTRSFGATPMTIDELSVLLRYTYGCHALADVYEGLTLLKKTSPSGGGLHPIEAYPLVVAVEGVGSGLYHYGVEEHVLELLAELSREEAGALVEEFTAGQTYLRSAQVLVVMTARFARSFWKYRSHPKAYPALLMDAAHLSQTLYLVATELGLGAFFTAAINAANVEERLGLDPLAEGAIAISGAGRPAPGPSPFDPGFRPFRPRETQT
jgi:putative peptide maturation dehydrogenase